MSEPAKRAKAEGLRLTQPQRRLGVLVVSSREMFGLELGVSSIGEWNTVATGGVRQSSSGRVLTTVDAELDLGRWLDRVGPSRFAIVAQSIRGESGGSLDSGDIQVYSNLESDENRDDIMELWYEREFAQAGARLKVGKVDANGEFAYVEVAGDFAHSSAGFSPALVGMPSYPDPATSANLFVETWSPGTNTRATLGYGLYDGALAVDGVRTGRRGPSSFVRGDLSNDYLHLLQWELVTDHGETEETRVSVGAFHHTGRLERFDGVQEGGTEGVFLTWERTFRRSSLPGGHVHWFAQYGWADDRVSAIGQHLAAGVVFDGPFYQRSDDRAGLYASLARMSDAPGADFASDELALDGYYRFRWTESVWIQPEVQFIVDPSGSKEISDALIPGLRLSVEF